MNREEVIRLANEAGLCDKNGRDDDWIIITDHLERFAALVAAHEREACADIAENWNCNGVRRAGVAAQIRARGE